MRLAQPTSASGARSNRDWSARLRSCFPSALIVVVAVGMLGYSLVHLDLAAFARDEPQFLAAAQGQLRTGHWLSANPFYGNVGLRYGPSAFWFYGAVQYLFGADPHIAILAMGLMITLAHLMLAFALTDLFAGGAVFFGVLLAWIASSPYQFYWSRLAWDLTSNAGVAWAVVLLCLCRELRPGAILTLGVLLGLAFSTHPSVTPFLAAVGIALAWELRSQTGRLAAVGGLLATAILSVSAPYLFFLLSAPVVQRTPRVPVSLGAVASLLLESPRVATTWGLGYLFGGDWTDFLKWLGPAAISVPLLSGLGLTGCVVGSVTGLATTLTASDPRQRRVASTALLAWTGSVLLLAMLGLEHHPHYQFSSAWVPVYGVAASVAWLRRRKPRAGTVALAVLGAIALAQFVVIVQWMGYVRERGGTRGGPYSTPLGVQIRAIQAVCSVPEPVIILWNETAMYPYAFEYLATTDGACHGKTVVVCAPTPNSLTKTCPPRTEAVRLRRLSYASEKGGALRVE